MPINTMMQRKPRLPGGLFNMNMQAPRTTPGGMQDTQPQQFNTMGQNPFGALQGLTPRPPQAPQPQQTPPFQWNPNGRMGANPNQPVGNPLQGMLGNMQGGGGFPAVPPPSVPPPFGGQGQGLQMPALWQSLMSNMNSPLMTRLFQMLFNQGGQPPSV